MLLNDYQIKSGETAIYPGRGSNLVYTLLGLCGETAEVAEKVAYLLATSNELTPEDHLILVNLHNVLTDVIDAGKAAEKLKKEIRDGKEVDTLLTVIKKVGKEITFEFHDNMAKELGDILWYLAQLSWELGIKLNDVAKWNLAKLFSRKDRNTLHGSGDDR